MFRKSTGLRNKLLGIYGNRVSGSHMDEAIGNNGWEAAGANVAVVSGGYSGDCYKIENSGAAKGILYQEIDKIVIGRIYYFEGYVKAGNAPVRVKIYEKNDNTNVFFDSDNISDGSNWTKLSSMFEVTQLTQPDTPVLRIEIEVQSETANDFAYADEFILLDMARSIRDIFKNSVLEIYTGSQPNSADDPPQGTLLVKITNNGSDTEGLTFGEASEGKISKNSSEVWSGTAVATGTAGWFRLKTKADDDQQSDYFERIDGAIGTSGAELNMVNTYIETGSVQTISSFEISINP